LLCRREFTTAIEAKNQEGRDANGNKTPKDGTVTHSLYSMLVMNRESLVSAYLRLRMAALLRALRHIECRKVAGYCRSAVHPQGSVSY
jgi:hypothetical protein